VVVNVLDEATDLMSETHGQYKDAMMEKVLPAIQFHWDPKMDTAHPNKRLGVTIVWGFWRPA
jgi:hypothetical protein